MTTKTLKLTAIAAALFAIPAFAFAQPRNDNGDREGRRAKMIEKYDANRDGTLDAAEKQALRADMKARHQARRAKMIEKYDANRDGTLDEAEREAMHQARIDAMFARLDTNGDGVLTKAEFAAGKKAHGKWGKRGKRGHRGHRGR